MWELRLCARAIASQQQPWHLTDTSCAEGVVDVFSENSYGVCVPVNSSANEIIVGMARASALQNSGSNGKAEASYLQQCLDALSFQCHRFCAAQFALSEPSMTVPAV